MIRNLLAAAVVATLSTAVIAADLKSGPQTGEQVPGPFHPLNINGEDAGKKACLYCKAGDDPVVAIFARTADCPCVGKLAAAVDAAADKHAKANVNAFAVFCSSDEKLEGKLKTMAENAKLKKLVLAIEAAAGPEKYDISKDADITVIVYKDRTVAANFAFPLGKMTEKDVEKVVAEIAKVSK